MIAFGLIAVTISATTSYCWNRAQASGDTDNARKAAHVGDSEVRHQAIKVLFEDAAKNIETLQLVALHGDDRDRQQAEQALGHLRRRLR